MRLAHMDAGRKGVQPLDPMGKALFHQKLQRAIGDGGLVAIALGRKPCQNVIGPQRAMLFQQDLQYTPPHGRQARAIDAGQSLSPDQRIFCTMRVVMHRKGKIRGSAAGTVGVGSMSHGVNLTGYSITYIYRGAQKRKAQSMRSLIALCLTSSVAMAEVPTVVTDIAPVHSIVAMVMGDLGSPDLLLAKGADEHDFQLKPSQMDTVATADLVVWVGPVLTPWLDSALGTRNGEGAVLTLSDDVGTYKINFFAGNLSEADANAEGTIDPHVWLDPSTAQFWTGMIAAELSQLDPENAATYAANAEAASATIAKAEAEAKALLDPVKDRPFVTFHDAYGYYITYFGLTPAGTISLGEAAPPGAARLSDLRAKVEAGTVICIFPEAQHDSALVDQLAEGTSAKIGAALDPVGSTLEPGAGAYAALITGTAKTLADCLAD